MIATFGASILWKPGVLRLLVFATQIFQRPLEFLPVFALTHLPAT